jgi:hypothetical protein
MVNEYLVQYKETKRETSKRAEGAAGRQRQTGNEAGTRATRANDNDGMGVESVATKRASDGIKGVKAGDLEWKADVRDGEDETETKGTMDDDCEKENERGIKDNAVDETATKG